MFVKNSPTDQPMDRHNGKRALEHDWIAITMKWGAGVGGAVVGVKHGGLLAKEVI